MIIFITDYFNEHVGNTCTCRCYILFLSLISLQVLNKLVFLTSALANRGVFTGKMSLHNKLLRCRNDIQILYHSFNLVFCLLGWIFHEFFYCLLVSIHNNNYMYMYICTCKCIFDCFVYSWINIPCTSCTMCMYTEERSSN